MKLIFLILLTLAPCTAYAQLNTQTEGIVKNDRVIYSAAALTSSANGAEFYFPSDGRAVLLELIGVYNSGTTTTMDVKLQHSNDGVAWFNIPAAAFTQVGTTSANYEMHVNRSAIKLRPRGRIVVTLAGTSPNYDATVNLYTD